MSDSHDYYGHRLAAINKQSPVHVSEDIRNQQGAVLLKKGAQFSEARADLVAKHKLIKPLEQSVDIGSSFDAQALNELILKFAASLPGLNAVVNRDPFLSSLQDHCDYYAQFPLVRQKLTVLAKQLPQIYYDSLYSATAGLVLAQDLTLDQDAQRCIFIAGLMHNIGYLHLEPRLMEDESRLDPDDAILAQSHPIIAQKFLDQVPGLPKNIGLAVVDHHERTDGTGYPRQKFGPYLSIESQIIAFTDMIVESFKRCMVFGDYAHHLTLTILQLNENVHFKYVYQSAAKLFRLGPLPDTAPKNVPLPRQLLQQQERITQTFEAAKKLGFILMKNAPRRLAKSIAAMLGRLTNSLISSGIIQEEYHVWLKNLELEDDQEEYLNLLKSLVMQDEIEVQMERFKRIMWRAIREIPEDQEELIDSMIKTYQQIDSLKASE